MSPEDIQKEFDTITAEYKRQASILSDGLQLSEQQIIALTTEASSLLATQNELSNVLLSGLDPDEARVQEVEQQLLMVQQQIQNVQLEQQQIITALEGLDAQYVQLRAQYEQAYTESSVILEDHYTEVEEEIAQEDQNDTVTTERGSRFNLARPKQAPNPNRIRKTSLRNQIVPEHANFNDLHRGGERIMAEDGEKVVVSTNYALSDTTNLHIRGTSFDYRNTQNNENYINAEYDKKTGELGKMHFSSSNPVFSGKAILDMVERIPVGASIFGKETSMSADSFPLFVNSLAKFEKKTPGRFTVEHIGEFDMNDQGKFSAVSKADNIEVQLGLINKHIDDYASLGAASIPHARIVDSEDGGQKIVLPKLKVTKNF